MERLYRVMFLLVVVRRLLKKMPQTCGWGDNNKKSPVLFSTTKKIQPSAKRG